MCETVIAKPLQKIYGFITKGKQQRDVPLTQKSAEAIQQQLNDNKMNGTTDQQNSVYLFPSEVGTILQKNKIDKPFLKGSSESGYPSSTGLHFHSLRHGYGTRLASLGFTALEIQRQLGRSG